jgi:AcrR family transcriptional regulator
VAAHAGVALGTLYRRFSSKEDLLVAALDAETRDLERRFRQRPPKGEDQLERVTGFFGLATKGMLRRPNLARALLKAVASGEPELAQKVVAFHDRVESMIVMSLRGKVSRDQGGLTDPRPTENESQLADTLELIWFALLVGWSGGVHDQTAVINKMGASAELVIRGSWEIQ